MRDDSGSRALLSLLMIGLLGACDAAPAPGKAATAPASTGASTAGVSAATPREASASREVPKAPSWIDAGPMIGHVGPDEVRVWVRVRDELACAGRLQQGALKVAAKIQDLGDGCRLLVFGGLQPDKPCTIRLGREGIDQDAMMLNVRTAPPASQVGKLTIAFGSCCRDSEYKKAPIFDVIPKAKPDVMIFAGDNSYMVHGGNGPRRFSTTTKTGDWDSREKMIACHLRTRRLAALQNLIRTTPCYATWDDHDYGPNDAMRDFVNKEAAMTAFRQVWANPGYGSEGIRGIHTTFRRGPVEFFLLDNRWHKWTRNRTHPRIKDSEATIWGREQFAWLRERLRASDAPVKVIVNGTQIFERGNVGEGHWQEAKIERAEFERFLRKERIAGVVVLSGDRHHSELMRVGPKSGAWIYEFTSSPLQYGQEVHPIPAERSNPTRIWGTRGNAYGLVTIDVRGPNQGTIRFEVRDERNRVPKMGAIPCTTTIKLSDLQYADQ